MFSRLTPVVKSILIVTIGLFLIQMFTGQRGSLVTGYLSLYHIDSPFFQPYQFLTYMLLHADFFHLLFNMLAVFMFGPALEHYLGEKRFLTLYLVCGLGAGALYMGIHYWEVQQVTDAFQAVLRGPSEINVVALRDQMGDSFFKRNPDIAALFEALIARPSSSTYLAQVGQVFDEYRAMVVNTPMLGASGAVFGLLMAMALIYPNQTIMIFPLPIPIKMKWFVLIYGALELVNGVRRVPGDNVAHFAHIGGMVFALVLVYVWKKQGGTWRRQ